MDWQEGLALALGALTAMLLVRRWFRLRNGRKTGKARCGCLAATATPPRGSIVYSARKGERPRILIRS